LCKRIKFIHMIAGTILFLIFFGMALWILLFLFGFIGLWVQWRVVEIMQAQMAKRGPVEI